MEIHNRAVPSLAQQNGRRVLSLRCLSSAAIYLIGKFPRAAGVLRAPPIEWCQCRLWMSGGQFMQKPLRVENRSLQGLSMT